MEIQLNLIEIEMSQIKGSLFYYLFQKAASFFYLWLNQQRMVSAMCETL